MLAGWPMLAMSWSEQLPETRDGFGMSTGRPVILLLYTGWGSRGNGGPRSMQSSKPTAHRSQHTRAPSWE